MFLQPKNRFFVYCLLLGLPAFAVANIRLPSVLADNMVLQRNSTAKLWGWANAAEKIVITASWRNSSDTVTATGDARWTYSLPTPEAGGPYTIILKGQNTIELKNILVGEVWICSGQSNMEWSSLQGLKEILAEMPKSANPAIRLFNVPKATSDHPQDDLDADWQECGPESLKGFSAVGYYFGKKLYEKLKIPIGLINSSWGGTPAEVWAPEATVMTDNALKAAAEKIGEAPWWPTRPGKAWNAMIAPLTGFNIAGAIWYQGESNVMTASTYEQVFTKMIGSWRTAWKKEFPFYYVQIAPFTYGNKNTGALLREAQSNSQAYAKTGMVVVTDLVDNVKDIHPQNKHSVGERLANYALADTYGQTGIQYRSPAYKTMAVDKNTAVLSFDFAEAGFNIRGPKATEWFVAGEDKKFYPADVKLVNNTIVLSSKQVKVPVAVRYGFSNEAIGNTFGKSGLPLNPFRTDSWELDTSEVAPGAK